MKPSISAFSILCLLLWGLAEAAVRPAAERTRERYNILVERNIFVCERVLQRKQDRAETKAAPRPTSYQVLAGVVQQGDEFIAFIEDTRGGTKVVRSGDLIAEGCVKTINLDSIGFEQDGKTTTVKIGDSLKGGPRPPVAKVATKASDAAKPGAEPATSDSQAAILERLRQRRSKEIGDQ